MKVLVFGLGALGTVYSCLLKKQGHMVVGFARNSKAEQIRKNGIKVCGIWGKHETKLDYVVSGTEDIQDISFDLIIVTVKSFATEDVASQLTKILSPETYVFLAQNGYGNFESAAKYIPEERIILGRVIFGAETISTGVSKVSAIADDVILGNPKNLIGLEILNYFAGLFNSAGVPTRTSTEIMKYIWDKIIYNSALNPLGALLDVSYGELTSVDHARVLINGIVKEIFAVINAMGQEPLTPSFDDYIQFFYEKLLPPTGSHHSSMLQDIRNGRKTEIDSLNGAIVRLGREYGVSTPYNEMVTLLSKAQEKLSLSDK
ncbi:ketopantoate reductase [Desulforamulus reducens MI-1]|uniref:2-dehydropantoate 2-reductase n=1 Tax=Desulforamulus reducens (strain ATCC BAA-1160 / DSM 100696 / MI-1) TaxID=349161 RepID=A4J454_DESRM|nr:2-dehydropantoate 2-reductase [Desulforamulus reducens]ABO49857.1 ketopantoate reductase [Desulforamulus reducens MI-1]